MANNIKKEEAKKADGIEEMSASLTSLSAKIEKNKKPILYIIGGVLVVILAGFGWYFWHKHANKKSAEGFSTEVVNTQKSITDKMQKESLPLDSAQTLLDNAMIKNLSAFAAKEEGNTGADLANIKLAALYYNQGKIKDALAAIEKADIDEPIMKMQAIIFKGDCYVGLNKYGEALEAYNKAYEETKEDNPEIAARALIKKAGVLSAQNKHADALAAYEQVIKDYPEVVAEVSSTKPVYDNQTGQIMGMAPGQNIEAYAERERALAGK